MFRKFINKEIRADLDTLFSEISRLKAKMEALETNMTSLRGFYNRLKSKRSEEEGDDLNPSLTALPKEIRDFYTSTVEYQQAQKLKTLTSLEEDGN